MTVHSNVYIPKESWPYWTWFAIEFFIVLATSLLIANEIMPIFDEMNIDKTNQNWIFWSIVAVLFFDWYIMLRRLVLRRKLILENIY